MVLNAYTFSHTSTLILEYKYLTHNFTTMKHNNLQSKHNIETQERNTVSHTITHKLFFCPNSLHNMMVPFMEPNLAFTCH